MRIRLTANQVFTAAIVLALLVFYTVFRVYYSQYRQEKESVASIISSQDLLYHTEKLSAIATAIETDSRAYLITSQQQFNQGYSDAKAQLNQEASILKKLSAENAGYKKSLDSLLGYINERALYCDSLLANKKNIDMPAALQIVAAGKGKIYLSNIQGLVNNMQQHEQARLQKRKSDNAAETLKEQASFLLIAFIMLALLVVLFWNERQNIQQKERKKAQQELEYLNLQINQSNDAIFIVDANRKIKSWNKGAENLYGFTKEDVMNRDPNQLLQTGLSSEAIDLALKQISEKEYWTGELTRVKKDGTNVHVRSSTTVIRDDKRNITGYVAVSFDISAQKKLLEQVHHLASMVEQSSEAIFSRDINQYIISWNKGAETLFGYSKEEAIGKRAPHLKITGLLEEQVKVVEQEIKSHDTWKSEMNFFRKDGSSFFGSVTGNVIKNERGEIVSFYFIIKDISLRKTLEEQLQRSNEKLEEKVKIRTAEILANEKRFRTLIENNYDIITLMDPAFKIVYRSPSAARITGWSDEEMTQSNGENKMAIHPDDREKADRVMAECLANPGKPIYATYRNQHKKGHYIWLEGAVTNLLHDPNVSAILYNFRDVTERVDAEDKIASSENRFRSLIENISDAIVLNDLHSNILYQSPSVTRILGFEASERMGKKVTDFIHPDDYPDFIELYSDLENTYDKPIPFQFRFLHKRGHYVWLEGVVSNLLNNPAVNAYVANYRDITERKKTEIRIKNLNAELEERVQQRTMQLKKANEELEAFSYSVSHDLRAPLRAIIGFSTILEEDYSSKLDDEAKRITAVIKSNTVKMGNLIDDLLTFSRMGRHEITRSDINTTEMVNDIINTNRENGNAIIKWAVHSLPEIKADASMLRQVWINLISNAVKYSRTNSAPEIQIGSFKHEGMVVFFVEDNGVGFDQKYKNKLFKVFQRLHNTEDFEGTGIGLAIVEKIVSKHGGLVWAEAEVNKGASFYFSLPEN